MQREWADKDFYKELGVSKDATQEEIKKAVSYTHLTLPTICSV